MDFSSLRLRAIVLAALLAVTLFSTLPAQSAPAAGPQPSGSRRDAGDAEASGNSWGERALRGLTGRRAVEPAERPRLRAVSTAPTRPRLADRGAGGRTPANVQVLNARLRIDGANGRNALHATLSTPGVRFATRFYLADVPVRSDGGEQTLRVAFVDPARFRTFTPSVTARVEPVWRAADRGELLLTHEAAREHGIAAGEDVRLRGNRQRLDTRVGALVSLGRAGVADALLPSTAMERLGVSPPTSLLVAVDKLGEIPAVAERLSGAGVGAVSHVPDIAPFTAELVGDDEASVAAFEPFTFTQTSGGAIDIDPGWVERNITKTTVPIVGEVACHRLIVPQMRAALAEIEEAGLAGHIDSSDYGGCYNPRHIDRDPAKSLSMHAWGVAFDLNVQTNLLGADPQLDERIVDVFERHGFNWGGHWRRPDGMHFELGVLQDP